MKTKVPMRNICLFTCNGDTPNSPVAIQQLTRNPGDMICDMWAVPKGMTATGASTPPPSNCMYDFCM